MTASSVKPKPKKANKAEVTLEESSKKETQANATVPTTPKPRQKGKREAHLRQALLRLRPSHLRPKREARVEVRVSVENQNQGLKRENSSVFHSFEAHARKETNAAMSIR